MDKDIIVRARKLSRQKGKSLSKMVANYFEAITTHQDFDEDALTPRTKKLFGSLSKTMVSIDDYRKY